MAADVVVDDSTVSGVAVVDGVVTIFLSGVVGLLVGLVGRVRMGLFFVKKIFLSPIRPMGSIVCPLLSFSAKTSICR
jgi:hypothetical protein